MCEIAMLAGFMGYLVIGWVLADLSWQVWHARCVTQLSYLLFPLASWRRCVGDDGAIILLTRLKQLKCEAPLVPLDEENIARARNEYCLVLAACWPVKIICNAVMLPLLPLLSRSFRPEYKWH